jgi:uncharacterized phage protein (TIGR02218 family)
MNFDQAETSLASGAPLRLYKFTRGPVAWCYTAGDRDIEHQAMTYKTVAGGITDDGIRQSGQAQPDQLTITAPASLDVAQLYRAAPPSSEIALTLFARHTGVDDYLVYWSGGIRTVKFPALDRCEIVCSPLSSRMSMTGLRLSWGRACPHALYSHACTLSPALWRIDGQVQALDGAVLQCPAAAMYNDGYFTGGYIEWAAYGGLTERRGIEAHAGAKLRILGGTAGIAAGAALKLYPGCDQSAARCKQYNNYPNFGGIPHLPEDSPFDGHNPF